MVPIGEPREAPTRPFLAPPRALLLNGGAFLGGGCCGLGMFLSGTGSCVRAAQSAHVAPRSDAEIDMFATPYQQQQQQQLQFKTRRCRTTRQAQQKKEEEKDRTDDAVASAQDATDGRRSQYSGGGAGCWCP